jgi:hypothetical protein
MTVDDDFLRFAPIERLARSFPALEVAPSRLFYPAWDPVRFAENYRAGSGGEKDAALFVLSVWNPTTNWWKVARLARDRTPLGGYFDVHRALGNWDPSNRSAFLEWAKDPWWA